MFISLNEEKVVDLVRAAWSSGKGKEAPFQQRDAKRNRGAAWSRGVLCEVGSRNTQPAERQSRRQDERGAEAELVSEKIPSCGCSMSL